jgi:hypothetical protein
VTTLDLQQAAAFCKKSTETMKRLARDRKDVGAIAAKVGREWLWLESDLLAFLRAQHTAQCPSTGPRTVRTGTSTSRLPATHDYVNQLDTLIAQRRKKSMT